MPQRNKLCIVRRRGWRIKEQEAGKVAHAWREEEASVGQIQLVLLCGGHGL
jgi:hypothetical protein